MIRLTTIVTICLVLLSVLVQSEDKNTDYDSELVKILKEIDRQALPEGYGGGKRHQPFVDAQMAKLSEGQRRRVGYLWSVKRKVDSKMPNPGASFVRVMMYVARGEKLGKKLPPLVKMFLKRRGVRQKLKGDGAKRPDGNGSISGQFVDSKGKPLGGVMVTAYDKGEEKNTTVFTSDDGSFAIDKLPMVEHEVRARLTGLLDEYEDAALPGTKLKFQLEKATGLDLQDQRTGNSTLGMLKWDSLRDKENFKMMCMYCHQVGTLGFRSPEKPVDWETMLLRMDGWGGLYKHTQKTLVSRLTATYKDDAVEKWPEFTPPPAPTGLARSVKITQWDIGNVLKANVHDLEVGLNDGLIYAVDMSQNGIVTLDPTSGERTLYRMPPGSGGPHSIEPDNEGHMWVTLCGTGEMAKFDIKSKEFTVYSSAEAPRSRGAYPHTLRINPKDPEGLIWYTD
ncbi:MAG: carboxypeptidase regulatory-like domain-containing protein, partial [Planctomycetota bacterium]